MGALRMPRRSGNSRNYMNCIRLHAFVKNGLQDSGFGGRAENEEHMVRVVTKMTDAYQSGVRDRKFTPSQVVDNFRYLIYPSDFSYHSALRANPQCIVGLRMVALEALSVAVEVNDITTMDALCRL